MGLDRGRKAEDVFLEGRGAAAKGLAALEAWVNGLPEEEMAQISLAQLKAWRGEAEEAERIGGSGRGADAGR